MEVNARAGNAHLIGPTKPQVTAICYPEISPGNESPHLFVYHSVNAVSSSALAADVDQAASLGPTRGQCLRPNGASACDE